MDGMYGAHGDEVYPLDGSMLEGGGQILRNSIAYSALLRKSIRITSIRSQRSPPGLRAQHLKGIELVQELCKARLVGGIISSKELSFHPGPLQASGITVCADTQTAGSITMLIQTVLPVLLFQPSAEDAAGGAKSTKVLLKGGTNASGAPQIDYFLNVFLPVVETMFGAGRVFANVLRRGYYPKGGGEVELQVTPLAPGETMAAIHLTERGRVTRIRGYIYVGGVLPISMAWEMQREVLEVLKLADYGQERFPTLHKDLHVCKELKASGGGSGVVLWAETDTGCVIAGSELGNRIKTSKSVAADACAQLLKNLDIGACVDEFLQDQLIILMALAKGQSRVLTGPISLHTQTAIWVAHRLTGVVIDVEELADSKCLIRCDGLGYTAPASPHAAALRIRPHDSLPHLEVGRFVE